MRRFLLHSVGPYCALVVAAGLARDHDEYDYIEIAARILWVMLTAIPLSILAVAYAIASSLMPEFPKRSIEIVALICLVALGEALVVFGVSPVERWTGLGVVALWAALAFLFIIFHAAGNRVPRPESDALR